MPSMANHSDPSEAAPWPVLPPANLYSMQVCVFNTSPFLLKHKLHQNTVLVMPEHNVVGAGTSCH
jgi:hypothetical protein